MEEQATTFTSNALLTGNGASAISSESNLSFDTDTLTIDGSSGGKLKMADSDNSNHYTITPGDLSEDVFINITNIYWYISINKRYAPSSLNDLTDVTVSNNVITLGSTNTTAILPDDDNGVDLGSVSKILKMVIYKEI